MDFSMTIRNNFDTVEIMYFNSTGKHRLHWILTKKMSEGDYIQEKGEIITKYPMRIVNRFVRKGWIVNEISDLPF